MPIKKAVFLLIISAIIFVIIFALYYIFQREGSLDEKNLQTDDLIIKEQDDKIEKEEAFAILDELDKQINGEYLSREEAFAILDELDKQINGEY